MSKKFGVSVGLLSAIAFFAGYNSFLSCIIILVLVLACSSEIVLKKNVLSSALLSLVISLVNTVLYFLSSTYLDILNFFNESLGGLGASWIYNVTDVLRKLNFANFIADIIGIVYFVATVIFIILALKGKEVKVPVLTKCVEKHLDKEEV